LGQAYSLAIILDNHVVCHRWSYLHFNKRANIVAFKCPQLSNLAGAFKFAELKFYGRLKIQFGDWNCINEFHSNSPSWGIWGCAVIFVTIASFSAQEIWHPKVQELWTLWVCSFRYFEVAGGRVKLGKLHWNLPFSRIWCYSR